MDETERIPEYDPEEQKRKAEAEKMRKRKRRLRRKLLPLFVLLFLVLVCALSYLILSSKLFFVRDIRVEGNRYYTSSQVVELSGLKTGKNILFELKTRPARDSLLETPYISFAEIKRKLPGTIIISVTERTEYAAIPSDDKFIIIDSDGMVLRIADKEPTMPILEGMTITGSTPGKPLTVEQTYLLSDTLNLLKAADETDLYFKKVYFSTVVVRTYIYDSYYCEGTPANIMDSLPKIKKLVAQHYTENVSKGVIMVGEDGYFAFSPKID